MSVVFFLLKCMLSELILIYFFDLTFERKRDFYTESTQWMQQLTKNFSPC